MKEKGMEQFEVGERVQFIDGKYLGIVIKDDDTPTNHVCILDTFGSR